jgi:hypothetical protein
MTNLSTMCYDPVEKEYVIIAKHLKLTYEETNVVVYNNKK